MKKNKKWLYIILITTAVTITVLPITLGIVYLSNWQLHSNFREHANTVEQHLNDKYGKEFKVIKVQNWRASLGSGKMLKSTFHPVDRPDLKFQMYELGIEKLADPHFGLHYDYIETMWSEQITQELKDDLEDIFGPNIDYYIYLDKAWGPDKEHEEEKFWYGIPSYEQVIEKYPDQIECFIYIVNYERLTEDNKGKEIKKVQELITLLHTKEGMKMGLLAKYCEPQYQTNVQELTGKYGQSYLNLATLKGGVPEWETILIRAVNESMTEQEIMETIETEKNKY